eukprot:COSAG01_NODE_50429_length_363_cov_1.185606_1_plen_89_part_01
MLSNAAYPYPSVLRNPLADFDLQSSIFLGARYDLAQDRHFLGKMALLKVYSSPVNNAEASCMFHDGFFNHKTAYEIMGGDWSSDVCSSD